MTANPPRLKHKKSAIPELALADDYSEKEVVASLMLGDPTRVAAAVKDGLDSCLFRNRANQILVQGVCELNRRGRVVDLAGMATWLSEQEQSVQDDIRSGYQDELVNDYGVSDVTVPLATVKGYARRRNLL